VPTSGSARVVGFWDGLPASRANWHVDKTWTPQMDPATRSRLRSQWARAVAGERCERKPGRTRRAAAPPLDPKP
jgi:hypothetical protein